MADVQQFLLFSVSFYVINVICGKTFDGSIMKVEESRSHMLILLH